MYISCLAHVSVNIQLLSSTYCNFLPVSVFIFIFVTQGCDMELMEDIKGLTAGVSSRKRGKRRYFWEYSEQLPPSKQERMLKPSEWDRHTLPSNLYQKNGPLHGMAHRRSSV